MNVRETYLMRDNISYYTPERKLIGYINRTSVVKALKGLI